MTLCEHTLLANRARTRYNTRVRLRNGICVLVCAELVSHSGGVVGHVVWCGLVGSAEAELFLEGTGGFGHLVLCLECVWMKLLGATG